MKAIHIPGVNGLGNTFGVEKNFELFLKDKTVLKFDLENVEDQFNKIYNFSKNLSSNTFFFGGDHSISYPLVRGLWEGNSNLKLIIFDAHPDLMKPVQEPTHEEWLRALVEDGFPVENILLVGVRRNSENIDSQELDFAKEKNIQIIFSDEVSEKRNLVREFASSGKVYFSLDIDVLDRSIFSATGYPEENGFGEEQFFELIDFVLSSGNLFWADLVEVNLIKISEKEKLIIGKILKRFNLE